MERKDAEKTTFALHSEIEGHLHNPADVLAPSEQAEPLTSFVTVTELTGHLGLYDKKYSLEESALCESVVSSST